MAKGLPRSSFSQLEKVSQEADTKYAMEIYHLNINSKSFRMRLSTPGSNCLFKQIQKTFFLSSLAAWLSAKVRKQKIKQNGSISQNHLLSNTLSKQAF